MAVKTQWRTTAFGLVGLDYNSLYAEAVRAGIELSDGLMRKIRLLEGITIKKQGYT